ncbi:MAG TPA: DNA repair protein RecN [Thermoanaerobaculia bacterium]|nr:DNA repair protein RecN [Thermoanaerobaculia bacterium]
MPMLRELHVRNLALLAEASVELAPGLNVLTGETGAGKSIVVDSLTLLSGARAASELIRTGADTLTVTGVFQPEGEGWRELLREAGVEPEGDELLVRREISRAGRNRVIVNDQPATLRLLADLAPWLLRIHGQREELGLVDPELQRVWLDESGGEEGERLAARVAAAYDLWARRAERLERASGDDRARRERLDLLRFQVGELAAAQLVAGEDTELVAERHVLRNAEAITRALGGAFELLYEEDGAAAERIGKSRGLLAEVAEWEPGAAAALGELDELRVRVEEVALDLRRRLDGLEADPRRLDEIEERLAALERLFRKYRVESAAELLELAGAIEAERDELAGDAEGREELERQVAEALAETREAALELSAARRRWAAGFVAAIEGELADLGLGKAKLSVSLEPRARQDSLLVLPGEDGAERPVDFGPHGVDQVVLLFAANPGEEARPLSLVASGGELSRIYLALQLAARGRGVGAGEATRPALVFDEVDAGIGGAQAAALGAKLQRLGRSAQILVVTHLPQVASYGDHHLKVAKEVRGERTFTLVEALGAEKRTEEVARMLGGARTTDLSLSHARELLAAAAEGRGDGATAGTVT